MNKDREKLIEELYDEYVRFLSQKQIEHIIDLIEANYEARVVEAVENRLKYHKSAGDTYQGTDFSACMYHRDKLVGLGEALKTIKALRGETNDAP